MRSAVGWLKIAHFVLVAVIVLLSSTISGVPTPPVGSAEELHESLARLIQSANAERSHLPTYQATFHGDPGPSRYRGSRLSTATANFGSLTDAGPSRYVPPSSVHEDLARLLQRPYAGYMHQSPLHGPMRLDPGTIMAPQSAFRTATGSIQSLMQAGPIHPSSSAFPSDDLTRLVQSGNSQRSHWATHQIAAPFDARTITFAGNTYHSITPNRARYIQMGPSHHFPPTYPAYLHYYSETLRRQPDLSHASFEQRGRALPLLGSQHPRQQVLAQAASRPVESTPAEAPRIQRPSEEVRAPFVEPLQTLRPIGHPDPAFWAPQHHNTPSIPLASSSMQVSLEADLRQAENVSPKGKEPVAAHSEPGVVATDSHLVPQSSPSHRGPDSGEEHVEAASEDAAHGSPGSDRGDELLSPTPPSLAAEFSDQQFRAVIKKDRKVDRFIASSREPLSDDSGDSQDEAGDVLGTFDLNETPKLDADYIASRVLYHRPHVKVVYFQDQDERRRLFLAFLMKPDFLPEHNGGGYISAWETSEGQEGRPSKLILRGIYEFTPREFREIDQTLDEPAQDIWLSIRTTYKKRTKYWRIIATEPSARDLERMATAYQPEEMKWRSEVGDYTGRVRGGTGKTYGSINFFYAPSLPVSRMVRAWRRDISLLSDQLQPIELTHSQEQFFEKSMIMSFRVTKTVKKMTGPNGETLILTYHARLRWMTQQPSSILSIWRIDPPQEGRATLVAVGLFTLSQRGWEKLTSRAIPGLRLTKFTYKMLGIQ